MNFLKPICAFLLLGSIVSNLNAQNSLLPVGTKIYYSTGALDNYMPTDIGYTTIEAKSDTNILGYVARKLEVKRVKSDLSSAIISNEFVAQHGDTIFYFNKSLQSFFPLYNFGLRAGDTLTVHAGKTRVNDGFITKVISSDSVINFSYRINSVDSVLIQGNWLKRQTVSPINNQSNWSISAVNPTQVFENFGAATYLFGMSTFVFPEMARTFMRCIEFNGTIVYKDSTWKNGELFYPCDYTSLPNGLNEQFKQNTTIKLFPNPTNQFFTISATNSSIKAVKLYNVTGQLVSEQSTPNAYLNPLTIDVAGLKNGLYLCVVELANGNTSTQKLVKQ